MKNKKYLYALFILFIAGFSLYYYYLVIINRNYPVTGDEFSYLFQAKLFAAVKYRAPSHSLKGFFNCQYIVNNGAVFSKYFFGWPLLLSIGLKLFCASIMAPFLSVLALFFTFLISKLLYDSKTGLLAVLISAGSLFYIIYSGSYLSQPLAHFLTAAGVYLYLNMLKSSHTKRLLNAVSTSFCIGYLFNVRPYDSVLLLLSLMIIGYILKAQYSKYKFTFCDMAALFFPFGIMLGLFFFYNYLQTGNILRTPYVLYNHFDRLGFGIVGLDDQSLLKHTVLRGLLNIAKSYYNLMLLLPPGALFLMFIGITLKTSREDLAIAVFLAAISLGYIFYFYDDARYFYIISFAIFILITRGIIKIKNILENYSPRKGVFLMATALSLALFIHWSIVLPKFFQERKNNLKITLAPYDLVRQKKIKNSIIFMKHVPVHKPDFYIRNDFLLKNDILYALQLNNLASLHFYYPEKNFYIYEYNPRDLSEKLEKI